MNTPLSFPLAKLLKEKGFDDYCDKKYIAQCLWQNPYNREKYRNTEIHKNSSDVSAPTIAEVVMWLYEKHEIWIYTRPFSSGYFHGYIVDNSGEMKEAINNVNFNSPKEACEAAIEYVLKNLINEPI